MNLLVFGTTGQVAQEIGLKEQPGLNIKQLNRSEANLLEPELIRDIILKERPDVILNLAAYTEVDKAEDEEEVANIINAQSPTEMAKAAEEINADILCIGTELEKFVANRPDYWLELIKNIKKVYKGKLTYAANWDEYKRIAFWGELDFIGIDAYFPLSDKKTPTVKEFENGWKPHKDEISRIQKQFNIPIIFTEFGYRSLDFTGKKPWESNRVVASVNLQAQVNGLQAIYNQFWKEDWFAGGFIWKWFHKHEQVGGKNNNRFTPQNKPAEELLRKLYAN